MHLSVYVPRHTHRWTSSEGQWNLESGGLGLGQRCSEAYKWPGRNSINPSQGAWGPGRVGDSGKPGPPAFPLGFPHPVPRFLRKRGQREGRGLASSPPAQLTRLHSLTLHHVGVSQSQRGSLGHCSVLISSCSPGLPGGDGDPLAAPAQLPACLLSLRSSPPSPANHLLPLPPLLLSPVIFHLSHLWGDSMGSPRFPHPLPLPTSQAVDTWLEHIPRVVKDRGGCI